MCVTGEVQNSSPASCQPFFNEIRMPRVCAVFSVFMSPPVHHCTSLGEGEIVPQFEKYRVRHIRAKSLKCFKKGKLKLYPEELQGQGCLCTEHNAVTQRGVLKDRGLGCCQESCPASLPSMWSDGYCTVLPLLLAVWLLVWFLLLAHKNLFFSLYHQLHPKRFLPPGTLDPAGQHPGKSNFWDRNVGCPPSLREAQG